MLKAEPRTRLAAILTATLLFGLLIVPLASVTVTAGLQAWQFRAYDSYRTSSALVELSKAHEVPEGIVMPNMARLKPRDCDLDVDSLPDWIEGNDRFWAGWGPHDAYTKLQILLSIHDDRLNGRWAIRTRYIADHTSDFERRFLIGCISGTLVAPVCFARTKALLAAADEAAVPPDIRLRSSDLGRWGDKVLCAVAKGLSAAKPSASSQQRD